MLVFKQVACISILVKSYWWAGGLNIACLLRIEYTLWECYMQIYINLIYHV